jgi:hypothetical protein
MLLLIGPIICLTMVLIQTTFAWGIFEPNPRFSGACKDPTTIKYFSIDSKYDNCGETCFPPSKFDLIMKVFEDGLREAGNDTFPCKTKGYNHYVNSPTHKVPFVYSIQLDIYSPGN